VLNAPFSVGDTLSTQSGIYVVGDLSALTVETFVPERFTASVVPGMRAALSFEAIPGERFYAEVYEISPVLDPVSRTIRIRLQFINPDPRIRAGMFSTLSLVTDRRDNIPVIPRVSAISTYGAWIVFVVDEDNIARRREVTFGLESEDYLEILSGVSLGENVVSAGQNFLTDGDSVRPVN
jgi:RND family efflux transporter MFP subunit